MAGIDASKRHYRDLAASIEADNHVADEVVDAMPDVEEVDRAVREAAGEMADSERRRSQESWLAYEDLRFAQRTLREERFFDVGFEMGLLAGAAGLREALGNPIAEPLRRDILKRASAARLPVNHVAAVLIEAARALLVVDGTPIIRGQR